MKGPAASLPLHEFSLTVTRKAVKIHNEPSEIPLSSEQPFQSENKF
jgi:hypothetical protein